MTGGLGAHDRRFFARSLRATRLSWCGRCGGPCDYTRDAWIIHLRLLVLAGGPHSGDALLELLTIQHGGGARRGPPRLAELVQASALWPRGREATSP